MQLLDRLAHHASTRPDELAYTDQSGHALTWKQLHQAACGFAGEVGARISEPGAILLCAANQINYPIAFLGCLRAGFDVFPISADVADAELRRAAQRSSAAAIIGNVRVTSVLPHLPSWKIEDVATVAWAPRPCPTASDEEESPDAERSLARAGRPCYLLLQSSGTTGLPKIVRRSNKSLDAVSAAMAEAVDFRPTDHVLAAVPLTHSYGLEHGLLAPVWAGSRVHLCRGLDLPSVVSELEKGDITAL